MAKAVSDKLFSFAMESIISSESHSSRIQIAAGFPENTLSVKASTIYCFIIFSFQV